MSAETEGQKIAAEIAEREFPRNQIDRHGVIADFADRHAPAIDAAIERARAGALAEAAGVCERKDAAFQQVRLSNPDRDLGVAAAIASEQRHSAKRIRALTGPSAYVAVRREVLRLLVEAEPSEYHDDEEAARDEGRAALDGGSDG